MLNKLKENFFKYLTLNFTLVLLFAAIRIFEQFVFNFFQTVSFSPIKLIGYGLDFDSLFVASCCVIFLVPFLMITLLNARIALMFIRVLLFLIFIVHISITQFFFSSLTLLDSTFFFFSLKEVSHIISSESSNFHIYTWAMLALFIGLGIWLLLIKPTKMFTNKRIQIISFILFPIFSFLIIKSLKVITPSQNRFDSFLEYQLANNKEFYFIKSYALDKENKKKFANIKPESLRESINRYHLSHQFFSFSNNEYPLVHNEDYENPLGCYFPESNKKPNVVYIIVESLSSSFCGSSTYLGQLTPFLDSLINKSLYWNNFLSNAEHTYGALPNILGSLPFAAERGFINNMNGIYPVHNSLISLLNQNKYKTRFLYGGWGGYDHTQDFIKYNQVGYLLTEDKFNKAKFKKVEKGKGNMDLSWGYNDKDLFRQGFDIIDSDKSTEPYFNTYLTLSLHPPYNIITKDYNKIYLEKYLVKHGIDGDKKKELMNYADGILSVLFTDDALKEFFENYKKRKDFNNTIFVITGDHNMYLLPIKNQLETYRVPLIIYSPMLKESRIFPAVSFHSDITPSIIGLLQHNFKVNFPKEKHWLGRGLDTSSVFRINNEMPLSVFSGNYSNYIGKNYLLFDKQLYTVDKDLNIYPASNEAIRREFLQKLEDFSIINLWTCANNKIIPKY